MDDIWDVLGFAHDSRVTFLAGRDAYQADEFIFTCNTPPLHPYLFRKAAQLMGVQKIPKNDRKTIIYLSRGGGKVSLYAVEGQSFSLFFLNWLRTG